MMSDLKHERKVIEEFVRFYNEQNSANYVIDYYPEDDKNVPAHKKIDAIYKNGGKAIVIEHTSLDGYILQRKKEKQFKEVLGPLENELRNRLPMPGHYSLIVQPGCDMPKKLEGADFRNEVRNKIEEKANILAIPKPGRLSSLKIEMKSIPFEFYLCRHNLNGKLDGTFYISMFGHESNDLDKQKEVILGKMLEKKNKKLSTYDSTNYSTILLLELIDYDWDGIYRSFTNTRHKFVHSDLPIEIYVINTSFPFWWCADLKKADSFSTWDQFLQYKEINKKST